MALNKICEICGDITRDGCRFCESHKIEVEAYFKINKAAAFERAVNLTKLHYAGKVALSKKRGKNG